MDLGIGTTSNAGNFSFNWNAPVAGNYTYLLLEGGRYLASTNPNVVVSSSSLTVTSNPQIVGYPLQIDGKVTTSLTGQPLSGITIIITEPDGTPLTLGPFISDNDGNIHITFIPTKLGVHEFQLRYPGTPGYGILPDWSDQTLITVISGPIYAMHKRVQLGYRYGS